MFGIGMQELFIILAVALIFIGPKRIPETARTLGKLYFDITKYISEAKSSFNKVSEDIYDSVTPAELKGRDFNTKTLEDIVTEELEYDQENESEPLENPALTDNSNESKNHPKQEKQE